MITLIPDVKRDFWGYILNFLSSKNSIKEFLSTKEGHSILELMHTNKKINKYQWYYISDIYPRDLLYEYIIPNFLNNINLSEDFSKSDDLKKFFDGQFEKLENEILLSDSFNYFILIPIYRVLFPSTKNEIEFDANHRIKKIDFQESPYGQWNFRAFPQSWNKEQERAANASFEATLSYTKRLANETPYEVDYIPMEEFWILKNDAFNQKIYSIFDFFLCYGPSTELGTLTIGDKCFIKTPPFFQQYNYLLEKSLSSEFSPPYTFLNLALPKGHPQYHNYIELWKSNYLDFYDNFYKDPLAQQKNDIFLYTLDVLRTFMNIPNNRIQCFLLISTFEGIMYHKKLYEKLNNQKAKYVISRTIGKQEKKTPCVKAFLEICEDQKEYWQYIFYNKYPMEKKLTEFKTKVDLEYFLNLSFKYRNNIAHPEKTKNIEIKEKYLYEPRKTEDIGILIHFINFELPLFLVFLLRTWLEKGFKNKTEWYDYILNLI